MHLVPGSDRSYLDGAADMVFTKLPRREHTLRSQHHALFTVADRLEMARAQDGLIWVPSFVLASISGARTACMALEEGSVRRCCLLVGAGDRLAPL